MKKLYCIPKLEQLSKYIEFSRQYDAAFEYNDFIIPAVLDDQDLIDNIIAAYLKVDRDRSKDTLHGVFFDICVHSIDSQIYKVSDYRIHQSMDIAQRLGCKAVIFHTNYIPNFKLKSYLSGWVNLNEKYWRSILDEYPNIEVYIENMFDSDSDLITRLAERMSDEPRFGICLDFAHAFLSNEPISSWCDSLYKYTKHVHLNDNDGIEDSHSSIGSGNINWEDYKDFIGKLPSNQKPTLLVEVSTYEELEKSVTYMKDNKMYPF